MDGSLATAALLSAALHAAWNAGIKSSADPPLAMTAQMLASAMFAAVALFWTGLPAAAAWPWMALSTTLSLGAVACLLRAYQHAGFGVVYPVARASSVLLVLPLTAVVAGEWPRPLGLAGVALVMRVAELLAHRARTLWMAVAATLSYWLILWVWTRAPIALASALRDTSAIFATLIAVTVLKERLDRRVLLAVALASLGTVAIRAA